MLEVIVQSLKWQILLPSSKVVQIISFNDKDRKTGCVLVRVEYLLFCSLFSSIYYAFKYCE